MESLVSIVVPVYNKEKYIGSCLDSIITQEYQNMEIILVDDGSTDNSGRICDEYAKKDQRICVRHQSNQGVSVARNQGIEMSKGKYICFWDSDDVMNKSLLSKCIPQMINQRLDMLYFNIDCRAEHGEGYWNKPIKQGITEFKKSAENVSFILKEFLDYDLLFFCGNKIYRRETILCYNLKFDQGVRIGEDLAFNIKYLLFSKKICGISDVLYEYWKRENSAMDTGGETDICINDFSRLLENLKVLYDKGKFPGKRFRRIFIKTMDNQYGKAGHRSEFKLFVEKVQNKRWLLHMTMYVLVHPQDFIALYKIKEGKRKWKDHLYILYYLLVYCKEMTRGGIR